MTNLESLATGPGPKHHHLGRPWTITNSKQDSRFSGPRHDWIGFSHTSVTHHFLLSSRQTMANITKLPDELVLLVTDSLQVGDLAAFARTSLRFQKIVDPILYEFAKNNVDLTVSWHPLRWAAENGQAGTLRKILARDIDPNITFQDQFDRTIRDMQTFQLRAEAIGGKEIWDPPPGISDEEWSPRDDDVDDNTCVPSREDAITARGLDGPDNETDFYGAVEDFNESELHMGLTSFYDIMSPDFDDSDDPSEEDFDSVDLHQDDLVSRRFTALHLAARSGHNVVVQILLDNGASMAPTAHNLCNCQVHFLPRADYIFNPVDLRRTRSDPYFTALHLATCHFQKTTSELLLARDPVPSSITTMLHDAAATGQTELLRCLLDKGLVQDVNEADGNGVTPLYRAYFNGHWNSTLPLLLEAGADINALIALSPSISPLMPGSDPTARFSNSCTILYEACVFGRYEDALNLMHLGANPDKGFFRNGGLFSAPLHAISRTPRVDITSYIEPEKNPPIKLSSRADFNNDQRKKVVEALLHAGADINIECASRTTPLHAAAEHKYGPALEALLAAGANVMSRDDEGRTPLMLGCIPPWIRNDYGMTGNFMTQENGLRSDEISKIRLLLDHGSGVNIADKNGNTVLHRICNTREEWNDHLNCGWRSADIMRLLLDRGARDDVRNKDGKTPLQVAFEAGNLKICDVLVRRRRKLQQIRHEELGSMLEYAIRKRPGHREAFSFIYDLDLDYALWKTPKYILLMLQNNFINIADTYLDRKMPPLHAREKSMILQSAIAARNTRLMKRMLAVKAPVSIPDENGHSPLHNALSRIDAIELDDAIEALLCAGADIHSKDNTNSMTPLQKSIATRRHTTVELMLRHQPLYNYPSAQNAQLLHTAARVPPSKRMFSLLIRSGAKVTELDDNGDTPLAVFLKSVIEAPFQTLGTEASVCSTAWYLWSSQIDVNRKNKAGKSILSYLDALRLYSGDVQSRKRVAEEVQRRISILPLPDAKNGEKMLRFSLVVPGLGRMVQDDGQAGKPLPHTFR